MHIIVTANTAWNIWNFRRAVIQSLLDDGHSVLVLAPYDESVALLVSLGCSHLHLKMDVKGLNPVKDVCLINTFRQVFRKEKPDIVLSYTIKNNLFGAIAARLTKTPFLPNVSGLGTAFLSGGFLQRTAEFLYRVAFAKLPVVFFQNSDDADLFVTRGLVVQSQVRLLPGSGVDLNHFSPAPSRPADAAPVFLMIARLLRDKGILEYVDAARKVKAVRPNAQFQVLGAIASENRTAVDKQTVDNWVSEGIITYLGQTDDVRPYIAAADCVVLPSYREGAPRTLIEASAMARPVITTDVPGCRTTVISGTTGYFCDAKSADSLTQVCLAFLDQSSEKRLEMGQAARQFMERDFDQEIVVSEYRKAISQLAKHTAFRGLN